MYAEIEKELLELEKSLDQRVKEVKVGLVQLYSADSKEQAIERENEEVLVKLEESLGSELAQVRNALKRLHEGEYGVCESCGGEIEFGRLKAMPFVTLCITCAEARE